MNVWLQRGGLVVLLLALQAAAYPEIYTWKDKSGVINFSGQPSEYGADKIEARQIPTYKTPDQRRMYQQNRVRDVLEYERKDREQRIAQQNETRKQQVAECAHATKELDSYLQAGYIYEKDNHGNKRILNEEERDRAIEQMRRQKQRLCNEEHR